jgi:hypothetical protein
MSTAIENRARRAANRVGLVATKSRWRAGTVDNHGKFMVIDPYRNLVIGGERFDWPAEWVIEECDSGRLHGSEPRYPPKGWAR